MMYDRHQIKSVSDILKNNKTNYWTGNECKKFEKEFSKYHNTKYSISVSNGSVALEIALRALNLNYQDEVIVTPRSFIISASCVLNLGLKPIFADVDHNGNLNIKGILKAYRKKVKAIILVHLNGLACDLDPITKFAKKKKLKLIEDCSQAHGAKYKGKSVGTFGDASVWSFCQDKIISTGGEGGMISTSDKKIWQKCWSNKDHGKDYRKVFNKKQKPGFKWLHDYLGSNYRMTEMQASLGRYQLKNLDSQIYKRNEIANLYYKNLNSFFESGLFEEPDYRCDDCPLILNKKCNLCKHSYYRLNFYIKKKKIKQKDIISDLNKNKIKCFVGSCPEIYREKIFQKLKVYPKKRLTNAKLLGETSIMFAVNPYKSISIIKKEIKIIKKVFKKYL
ncbi:DegT/DnrJ/EryC1/StrS family aminotransferase [Candidatus Pelagibacter bacterium nBUS_29]|uniref:DegT/DnrJ/EryC1/StrS aminotransferase family protein n=1 Tax=Candidatus Pelagibacter bacterium nBUS_29 TaxID=3374190 RepID=UPI003EBC4C7E